VPGYAVIRPVSVAAQVARDLEADIDSGGGFPGQRPAQRSGTGRAVRRRPDSPSGRDRDAQRRGARSSPCTAGKLHLALTATRRDATRLLVTAAADSDKGTRRGRPGPPAGAGTPRRTPNQVYRPECADRGVWCAGPSGEGHLSPSIYSQVSGRSIYSQVSGRPGDHVRCRGAVASGPVKAATFSSAGDFRGDRG